MIRIIRDILITAILLSLIFVDPLLAEPPAVAVDTRVKVALGEGNFKIKIRVEPHPANRRVCLHVDTNGFQDIVKACWNAGAKTEERWVKELGPGKYEVWADVERNDGKDVRSGKMTITVKGPGYEEPDPFESVFEPPF